MSTSGAWKSPRIAAFFLAAIGLFLLCAGRADAQDSQPTASVAIPWPNAGEAAIVRVLNQPAKLDYDKIPLEDVAANIGKRHQIPVQLDRRALDDAVIESETPVTCSLQGVPLKTALKLALRQLGLTYAVDNGVLLITTSEVAETQINARTYPVRDLLRGPDSGDATTADADSLTELIEIHVEPQTWDSVGGRGSLILFDGVLVANQSWRGHELIAQLLSDLRAARRDRTSRLTIGSTAAQLKLLKALRQPFELSFNETPLSEALLSVAEQHGISVHLDRRTLRDVGIDTATRVSFKLAHVSLAAALSAMLRDIQLDWLAKDGVLLVTIPEVADGNLQTRVYPADDLATFQDEFGEERRDFETLIDVLKTTCAPASWDDAGGGGAADAHSGALVISQTFRAHQLIESTLAALRKARDAQERPAVTPASFRKTNQQTEDRLIQALRKKVRLKSENLPLRAILAAFSQDVGEPILLDPRALEKEGISADILCTFQVKDAPLKNALDMQLLQPLGLAITFRYEALWITSREAADTELTTRVYPVRDLIMYAESGEGLYRNPAPLRDLISSTVAPESWEDVGGPGSMASLVGNCDALVCNQTISVHEAIELLLTTLRKQIEAKKKQLPEAEKAGQRPVVKAYPVSDGVSWPGIRQADRAGRPSEEQLAQLIRDFIEPESWDDKKDLVVRAVKGVVVVRNAQRVQTQVASLLSRLGEWRPEGESNPLPGLQVSTTEPDSDGMRLSLSAKDGRDTLMQSGGLGSLGISADATPYRPDNRTFRMRIKPPGYDESVRLEIYHLAPQVIVTDGDRRQTLTPAADKVAQLVEAIVEAKTWRSAGGKGLIRGLPGVIVVRQKGVVQRQVAKLLFEAKVWDPRGVLSDGSHGLHGGLGGAADAPLNSGATPQP